jgi:hypothetical protein
VEVLGDLVERRGSVGTVFEFDVLGSLEHGRYLFESGGRHTFLRPGAYPGFTLVW